MEKLRETRKAVAAGAAMVLAVLTFASDTFGGALPLQVSIPLAAIIGGLTWFTTWALPNKPAPAEQ